MEHKILYGYSEDQLEKIIEKTFAKFFNKRNLDLRKNEISIDDRIDQKTAAILLNTTVQTLIKWKKKNKIPYYQIEGTIFYSKSELLAFAKNNPKNFNRL